jgi:hypothetical protein
MNRDLLRQIVTVASFAATVVVNALANALPINGRTTAAISDSFRVFVIPAGFTFAIWGLIYTLLLVFTVYQALPSRRADPLLRRLGYLPALSGLLNVAWIFLWQYELFIPTLVAMVGLLLTLIAIYLRLAEGADGRSRPEDWAVSIPFRVYLGWITVATILNTAVALASIGVDGGGLQPEAIASAVLVVGLVIASTVVVRHRDVAYGLVIVWAYAGIYAKEVATDLVPAVAGAGAVLIAVLVAAILLRDLVGGSRTRTGAQPQPR